MASESRRKAWTKYNRSKKRKLVLARYNKSNKRKEVNKRYREKHSDKCNKWSRDWYGNNKEHVIERQRLWRRTKKGKFLTKEREKRYAKKYRFKRLAKDAVNNAVRSGKLIKMPCVKCGSIKSQGHHPDYNKPLEVIWLCHEHHHEIHNPRRYK